MPCAPGSLAAGRTSAPFDRLRLPVTDPAPTILGFLRGAAREIVTVFGGPQKTQEDLDALAARIGKEFPSLEIETHAGGPDLYDYLVTLE